MSTTKRNIDFGICKICERENYSYAWCKFCDSVNSASTGNKKVDKFLQDALQSADKYENVVEWIPFNRLEGLKLIAKGGYGIVYSATWLDGKREMINEEGEKREKNLQVAVKLLNNSKDITDDFLNDFLREIEFHYKYSSINLYGLTQDPDTKNYMMVLKFADNGNLRHYLESKFKELNWQTKLFFLQKIIDELVLIHKNESVHRDLHSGNILIHSDHYPCISDLGLARHANTNTKEKDIYDVSKEKDIYGVLPYVAPEVLCRKPYEKASDIYSFGILMTEISSGKPPHWKVPHDISLALEIINGLRPKFGKGTPKIYIKLAFQCMDADPSKRPTAGDCYKLIDSWCDTFRYTVKREEEISIKNAFISADKKGSGSSSSLQTYSNDKYTSKLLDGIYTSKLIDFQDLPKPKNSDKLLELIQETQELTNMQDFEISSDEEKYNNEL